MRSLFASTYAAERAQTHDHAARARRQQFEFFGQRIQLPRRDRLAGRSGQRTAWPPTYHADCRVHGGDVGFGDVKHVWELSRQQFLIDLGKAWFLDRNPEDLRRR